MIFLVISLLVLVPGVLLMAFAPMRIVTRKSYYENEKTGPEPGLLKQWGYGLTIAGFVLLVLGALLPTGIHVASRIGRIERVEQSLRVEQINRRKADELIAEFRDVLVERYPQYEREVVEQISTPGDLLAFFARYPELRTADTLTRYASEVKSLRSAVYRQQTNREALYAKLRAEKRNPWLVSPLLPDFEESEKRKAKR